MRNILKKPASILLLLPIIMVTIFSSCKKGESDGAKASPTIERIRIIARLDTIKSVTHRFTLDQNQIYDDYRLVPFDSTVVSGALNNVYAIVGTNLKTTSAVSFNGFPVYFNPTLVTENSVIVNTGKFTPYGPGQSDEIILTTKFGTVKFKFPIKQPIASITDFAPLAAGANEIVTINGTTFENLIAVRFGTINAEIVGTPTKTQIKVKVPAGVVQANIFVETAGGIAKSAGAFGFKYVVFDEALATSWQTSAFNTGTTVISLVNPKRDLKSLQTNFGAGYDGFKIFYNGAIINTATLGLTSIKLSIYGGPGSTGKRVYLTINGNYNATARVLLTLTAGVYTDFTVPLSSLGSPGTITEIVLQEYSGFAPSVIYVDDIGFI
ncbi:IPT/TIG domain-containing protein [Pedobacter sp. Leaf194]|uniref:IPT/TIG domain-containing protein n=1 Tax=Pedobacter sp. Leaf194 TaxID=1736297 RepID=UPI000AF714FF|nr:IPT/TIG domain-containing protein [Pedobacter sp. Leaf194]